MDNNTVLQNCLLSNFCNVIQVRLDNSNYVTWKFLLEALLRGCGLMQYVDGSFPCPPRHMIREEDGVTSDMTKEYMNWEQNDYAVMSILAATLSSDVLSFIVGSKTSRELSCLLKEKYASTSRSNIMHLKTTFQNIQKGSDSIDKYLLRVKIACDQLANVGVHLPNEDIICSVLHGLPSEYATMKAIIWIKRSPVSMQELRSLLLIAEDEIEQTAKSISLRYNCHVPSGVTNPNAYIASASSPITKVGFVPASAKMTTNAGFVNSPIIFPCAGFHSASNSNALMKNRNYMSSPGFVVNTTPPSMIHNASTNSAYSPPSPGFPSQYNGCFSQPTGLIAQSGNGMQMFYGSQQQEGQSQHNGNFNGGFSYSNVGQSPNYETFNSDVRSHENHSDDNHNNYPQFPTNRGFNNTTNNTTSRPKFKGNGNQSFGESIVCQICEKLGHGADVCYYRTSQPQHRDSCSSVLCQICKRPGHTAQSYHYRQHPPTNSQNGNSAMLACCQNATPAHEVWLPNSGVTNHMTSNIHMELWKSQPLIPPG